MTRRLRQWRFQATVAGALVVLLLSTAACDSGDDHVASSTSTATPAGDASIETLADYLVIVMRAARDSGVGDASVDLLAVPTIAGYRTVLVAVEAHLSELEAIDPPAGAVAYHEQLLAQTSRLRSLYAELIESLEAGDAGELQRLQQESVHQTAAAVALAAEQNDLLRSALEGRVDGLSAYVLEITELGERFGEEVPPLFERINALLRSGGGDREALADVLGNEAGILRALAGEWALVHPPQIAADVHVRQMQLTGAMAGYLDQGAAASRRGDDASLNDAFSGLVQIFGSVPETTAAQQDVVIAALAATGDTDSPPISWARVPDQRDLPFGFLFDVVTVDETVVGMGPVPYLSLDGASWFPAAVESDGFEAMTALTLGGPGLIAVGVAEGATGLDAAVWTSADGTTWDRRDATGLDTAERQQMDAVAAGAEGVVAIGFAGDPEDPTASIWFSTDFEEWFPGTITGEDMSALGIEDVAAGDSSFVAVGSGIWSSQNGIDWTRRGPTAGVQFRAVTTGGPGFVAVGTTTSDGGTDGDAAVWVSTDGFEWDRVADPELGGPLNQVMVDVTVVGDRLFGVGTESVSGGAFGLAVWAAESSGDWTRLELGSLLDGEVAQSPVAVAAGGPGVVIVGAAGGNPATWLGFIDD